MELRFQGGLGGLGQGLVDGRVEAFQRRRFEQRPQMQDKLYFSSKFLLKELSRLKSLKHRQSMLG
ncbi:MAG: hypothetical protein AAF560_32760, partial [Acidobacteriota bacterium]